MESIFLITAIIGLIELVKAANVRDWITVEIIGGAVIVGALVGFFHVDHFTIITGIQGGLAAAGTYRVGKVIGTAQPKR